MWIERIGRGCGARKLKNAFQVSSLVGFAPVAGGFGAYFGLLFMAKFMPRFTLEAKATIDPVLAAFARLLIAVILCGPFFVMFILVDSESFGESENSRYGVFFL